MKQTVNKLLLPITEASEDKVLDHYLKYSKESGRDSYMYLNLNTLKYSRHNLERTFMLADSTPESQNFTTNQLKHPKVF